MSKGVQQQQQPPPPPAPTLTRLIGNPALGNMDSQPDWEVFRPGGEDTPTQACHRLCWRRGQDRRQTRPRTPHLSRIGLSCSSSGLALPRIRFRASAYSASLWASDFTG